MRATEDFLDLYEHAPCGYLLLALDGNIVQANACIRGMLGLTAPEILRVNFRELLSSAGGIFYETQIIPSLFLNGSRSEIALDLVRRSGERVPTIASADLRYSSDRRPTHIRMILLEATERRQYERDLLRARKDAEQMAEVVLHSSDAIVTMRPSGKIKMWNKGAADMFGYSANEVMGREFSEIVFASDGRAEFDEFLQALRNGNDIKTEIVGWHKDGRRLDLSINLTPHMEAPGVLVAFSAIVRDVSMQKLAERALRQSEKLASVGRLASSIAHEINNPLAAVTNLLYLLELQAPTPELKTLAHTAQEELARVSQIATHTLRFHRQSTARSELDLAALFGSVLALYRAKFRNAGIEPIVVRSNSLPLFCHEGELRQIVLNLVGNAIDAMKTGGTLTLSSRESTWWRTGQRGVRVTIADSGTGMTEETVARIFEPFFSTKGIGGTGLGLWVTQDLVEKNSGFIRVRSRSSEHCHGSVFTLFFPHLHYASHESEREVLRTGVVTS